MEARPPRAAACSPDCSRKAMLRATCSLPSFYFFCFRALVGGMLFTLSSLAGHRPGALCAIPCQGIGRLEKAFK